MSENGEEYIEVLEGTLEDEDNPKPSFGEKGRKIVNMMIDKLKPNESTRSSTYNSEDCYLDEDEEFSLKSDVIYETKK